MENKLHMVEAIGGWVPCLSQPHRRAKEKNNMEPDVSSKQEWRRKRKTALALCATHGQMDRTCWPIRGRSSLRLWYNIYRENSPPRDLQTIQQPPTVCTASWNWFYGSIYSTYALLNTHPWNGSSILTTKSIPWKKMITWPWTDWITHGQTSSWVR